MVARLEEERKRAEEERRTRLEIERKNTEIDDRFDIKMKPFMLILDYLKMKIEEYFDLFVMNFQMCQSRLVSDAETVVHRNSFIYYHYLCVVSNCSVATYLYINISV